jgi:hypothetical protein
VLARSVQAGVNYQVHGDNYPVRRGGDLLWSDVLAESPLISFQRLPGAKRAVGRRYRPECRFTTPQGAVHRLVLWAGGLSTAGAGSG